MMQHEKQVLVVLLGHFVVAGARKEAAMKTFAPQLGALGNGNKRPSGLVSRGTGYSSLSSSSDPRFLPSFLLHILFYRTTPSPLFFKFVFAMKNDSFTPLCQ